MVISVIFRCGYKWILALRIYSNDSKNSLGLLKKAVAKQNRIKNTVQCSDGW